MNGFLVKKFTTLIVGVGERTSRGTGQGTIVFVAKLRDGRRSADKPKEQGPKRKSQRKHILAQVLVWEGDGEGFVVEKTQKKILNLFLLFFSFIFFGSCQEPLRLHFLFPQSRDAFGKWAALL